MSPDIGFAHAAIAAKTPLSAAIYGRVSKDPAGLQRSVEEQEDANRAECVQEGWLLTADAIYCDNDRSASRFATKDRPDWDRVREDLEARRYHVLVLWEVARGDRDDLGWIGFLHMCREVGILIHLTSHERTYDVRKRRDYKTLAEEGLDSADESEKISGRIRRDTEAMAKKGRAHGTVPYGYRREYEVDGHGKRRITAQLPDETPRTAVGVDGASSEYTRAAIVREIVARALLEESSRGIAADLNRRGIPAPGGGDRGWSETAVRRIAISPTHAGRRTHLGNDVAAAVWPPLVQERDHYALITRFSDPQRRKAKDTTIKYLGSGLYVCGVCGVVVRSLSRSYGMAYTCRPAKLVARSKRGEVRAATESEIEILAALSGAEQTARILDLVDSGVTQASVARDLGLWPSTLSLRLKAERARRGDGTVAPSPPPGEDEEPEESSYHVARAMKDVDDYVEMAVWQRLARPDFAELLAAQDARADERLAEMIAEIARKQRRLDEARDSYAADALSLDGLLRIESTLAPEVKVARARLAEIRVGPVLAGLLLPSVSEVAAEWRRHSLPRRRAVVRALMERVEILPLLDKKRFTIEESVRIVWRQSSAPGAAVAVAGDELVEG